MYPCLVCHSFAQLPLPKESTLKRQQTNCISLLVLFELRQIDNRSVVLYLTTQAIKAVEEERDDAGNNYILFSCLSVSFFSDQGLSRMWRMATHSILKAAMVSTTPPRPQCPDITST